MSSHPVYFDVINHKSSTIYPDLFIKLTYQVQYDWESGLEQPKSSIFGSILVTNIETNKCPPKMIYLSVLGAYWNE